MNNQSHPDQGMLNNAVDRAKEAMCNAAEVTQEMAHNLYEKVAGTTEENKDKLVQSINAMGDQNAEPGYIASAVDRTKEALTSAAETTKGYASAAAETTKEYAHAAYDKIVGAEQDSEEKLQEGVDMAKEKANQAGEYVHEKKEQVKQQVAPTAADKVMKEGHLTTTKVSDNTFTLTAGVTDVAHPQL